MFSCIILYNWDFLFPSPSKVNMPKLWDIIRNMSVPIWGHINHLLISAHFYINCRDYHCGLIGYQVKKKVQARASSFEYVGHNDPRLQPISVDKSAKVSRLPVGHADPVTSLPATDFLAAQSRSQQSG